MKANSIRAKWIAYFVKNKHQFIESASLVPNNDDSLLWINSGVAALKDYFTGKKKPPCKNLVNSQKSIRTNDIKNIGITSRHHTFFEMLGNYSIGGYFKKEMILMSLDFLINHLKIDQKKLYITYFNEDKETYGLWQNAGIPSERIISCDKETNFWDLGQGPCGPNTEIFYDRGKKYDSNNLGVKLLKKNIENDRYIEIWNIVFSEFNNDGKGKYTKLFQKNIDTGAGLERLASILQDVPTNYDSDLFLPIIKKIEQISNKKYKINNYFIKNKEITKTNYYFRVIADHIRAITLAINDGISPTNTGRGYIIRQLIRRAYLVGVQLGITKKEFLYLLVKSVASSLSIYKININNVSNVIRKEEQKFALTMKDGKKLIRKSLLNKTLNERIAFKLFETYGFPIELTIEIANENNIKLDNNKILEYFKSHSAKSKAMKNIGLDQQIISLQQINKCVSEFVGYDYEVYQSKIIYLLTTEKFVDKLSNKGMLISEKTPFYATKGGQFHDFGKIEQDDSVAKIVNVFTDKENNYVHNIKVISGEIKIGPAKFIVNHKQRICSKRNHSATHLLYSALREIFSTKVIQLGSDNNQRRLKFDFPLDHLPTWKELQKVQDCVNKYIEKAIKREYLSMLYKKAKDMGVLSLPKNDLKGIVRVVKFADVSLELCGGTHVDNSKDIEQFLITKVESIGSGIYRITAITSNNEINNYFSEKLLTIKNSYLNTVNKIKALNNNYHSRNKLPSAISNRNELNDAHKVLQNELHELKKTRKNRKKFIVFNDFDAKIINSIPVYLKLNISDPAQISYIARVYRSKEKNAISIIGSHKQNQLVIAVSSNTYDSNKLLQTIISKNNGKGGGNVKYAQGVCIMNPLIIKDIEEAINDL